ncbi:hypothetical protein BDF20DRAFT_833294 [Mycotypha africana]|uniref:uncharacterized protein n=1 Tax=Mycotypha africana TaxID=64632 RepID=UPI0023011E33|nr:uncharacterized protein BDF20DRAFT_833294 [Mycotypha africana]KAI8988439.1 hypothetical protein BDF20DRAFT_833294 [Mycotypha africana]
MRLARRVAHRYTFLSRALSFLSLSVCQSVSLSVCQSVSLALRMNADVTMTSKKLLLLRRGRNILFSLLMLSYHPFPMDTSFKRQILIDRLIFLLGYKAFCSSVRIFADLTIEGKLFSMKEVVSVFRFHTTEKNDKYNTERSFSNHTITKIDRE